MREFSMDFGLPGEPGGKDSQDYSPLRTAKASVHYPELSQFGEGGRGKLAPLLGTAKAAQGLWGATQSETGVWHEGGRRR